LFRNKILKSAGNVILSQSFVLVEIAYST